MDQIKARKGSGNSPKVRVNLRSQRLLIKIKIWRDECVSARYMRRSVEGSDDIDNNFSQVYIKIIKKSIWFWEYTIK